jgi:hypothetical protein
MLKKFLVCTFLFSFIFLLSGCQSINDVVSVKESGKEGLIAEYPVTYDQAWDIALRVLRWEGVDAIEQHKDQGYMFTSTGFSFGTAGTVIGVWVEKGSKPELIKVTVVTKRRIVTNVFTSLTEATYQKSYAKAVDIVKSGKPLPLTSPN